MDDKITLDRDSFKALSVDSRVNILKSLYERRKTLSELSKALGLKNSTVKEHLEVLLKAGLVKKIDEGYKWKYYALTMKGKNIVNPAELRVLITLAVSSFLLVGTMAVFLSRIFSLQFLPSMVSDSTAQAIESGTVVSKALSVPAGAVQTVSPSPVQAQLVNFFPFPEFVLIVFFALLSGICTGYLLRKKI